MSVLSDISREVFRLTKSAETNSPEFFSTTPTYLLPDPKGKIPKMVNGSVVRHSIRNKLPEPTKEYRKTYLSAGKFPEKNPDSIRPVNDNAMRANTGWYGMLGNPQLQYTLDAADDYAQERGSWFDKIMSLASKSPQMITAAVGGTALGNAAAAAYPRAVDIASKQMLPISIASGTAAGVDRGTETGSVVDGIKTGVVDAAETYVAGKLFGAFPKTMIGLTSAYPVAEGLTEYLSAPFDAEKKRNDAYTNMVSRVEHHPESYGSRQWNAINELHSSGEIKPEDYSRMKDARQKYMRDRLSQMTPEQLEFLISRYGIKVD